MKAYLLTAIFFLLLIGGGLFIAQGAMPDSPFYVLKRFEEKLIMSFRLKSADKISYGLTLLKRRLQEIDYVTGKKEYDLFSSTSLRYSTQAGDITQLVSDFNFEPRKEILDTFQNDQVKIKDILSRKDDKEDWKYIEDSINYLTIYLNKLAKSP